MTNSVEALTELIMSARGNRPQSLDCAEAEQVLNIALALLVELSVSNRRIDRLERMVADLRGEMVSELLDVQYDGEIAEERQEATEALLIRALRIILDPRAQTAIPTS